MPRNEQRPVKFGFHAHGRLVQRGIDPQLAESVVRSGTIRFDATCDFIAFGGVAGAMSECACLDRGDHVFVKTVYFQN